MTHQVFFIIGCVRSGTTALTKILNTATNANVIVEEHPKLCIESRDHYLKVLENPLEFLRKSRSQIIESANTEGLIYGDKNANYLPFVQELEILWKPKYIWVHRDGRDSVRSMMDWHILSQGKRGQYFGRFEDTNDSNIIDPTVDWWDYSRIRPLPHEMDNHKWKSLSRLEQCAWHWSKYNQIAKQYFRNNLKSRSIEVKMNELSSRKILDIFNFLNLEGFDETQINNMIHQKINRYKRNPGDPERFKSWEDWSNEDKQKFSQIAGKTMSELGYAMEI